MGTKTTTFARGENLAILVARHCEDSELLLAVLGKSEDPNFLDETGNSVLHHYILRRGLSGGNSDDIISGEITKMSKLGIDLDLRQASGNTPLHQAFKSGFYSLCLALIKNGVDPSQVEAEACLDSP